MDNQDDLLVVDLLVNIFGNSHLHNEMRGQIFMQPAKTAEFIVVDFNILPTGASFPE